MQDSVFTSFTSTLVGGALLAASSVATAQNTGPAPDLTLPEKGAFTLMDQALSLVAALIDRQGCSATAGNYTLGGGTDSNGEGSATIDDTTITVTTNLDDFRGTNQATAIPAPGQIGDVDFFNLDGRFWYSGAGEIMYADADFQLCFINCGPAFPGAEDYDEHVIKDFFADTEGKPSRLVLDQGLEVITKQDYPRRKYRQDSRYMPPDGQIGEVDIEKVSIAPSNAPQCFLEYDALVDDFGGGIRFQGTLLVFPL